MVSIRSWLSRWRPKRPHHREQQAVDDAASPPKTRPHWRFLRNSLRRAEQETLLLRERIVRDVNRHELAALRRHLVLARDYRHKVVLLRAAIRRRLPKQRPKTAPDPAAGTALRADLMQLLVVAAEVPASERVLLARAAEDLAAAEAAVRHEAASRLARVRRPEAVALLHRAAMSNDDALAALCVQGLASLAAPCCHPIFVARLTRGGEATRLAALRGLIALGQRADLGLVIAAMTDSALAIRLEACLALPMLLLPSGAPAERSALDVARAALVVAAVAALQDEAALVRATAANALMHLREPAAMPSLLCALKDNDAAVRANAAQACIDLGRDVFADVALWQQGVTAAQGAGESERGSAVPQLCQQWLAACATAGSGGRTTTSNAPSCAVKEMIHG